MISIVPAVISRKAAPSRQNGGSSGDGGNRTHGIDPTSCVELLQGDGEDWAVGLPVHGRRGVIRCFAIVDPEDFERLSRFRWNIDNSVTGYVKRTADQRAWFLHREVLGLALDDPRRVDHRNRNPLDCRKANLRIASTAENAQNQGSRGGSSRYRGVTWDKSRQKWMATAMLDGRRRTIGRFDSEDAAGAAVADWRREHMPFSADASSAPVSPVELRTGGSGH